MIRVATILSPRDWEPDLVAHAQATGAIALTQRIYLPEELDPEIVDVVVAGAETAWVTAAQIASWKQAGILVVGIHPAFDRPAARLLDIGGADEILDERIGAEGIVQAIRFLGPSRPVDADGLGEVVAVTGARGAPGRSEIAVALAWAWMRERRVVLVDCDIAAPSIAVRLGLPPRPDLTDAADRVRESGLLTDEAVHGWRGIDVVVGSHRPNDQVLRTELVEDVIEAARQRYEVVIVDCGPTEDDRLSKRADHAVVVAEASATGLVRAADVVARWAGPMPALILNRIDDESTADLVKTSRRWTGLDPAVLVHEHSDVRRRARAARSPSHRVTRPLRSLAVPG
ncbi:MAG: hypothetical protein HKN93_00915 [Acidimicrobiia bacterium]|nr:hypothetical protein [Acidimicrobiia bacterium]